MAHEKKVISGEVVSNSMQKTAVVEITKFIVHPLYKKRMIRNKRYAADNSLGATVGQQVKIQETRPESRTKRWRIVEIIK